MPIPLAKRRIVTGLLFCLLFASLACGLFSSGASPASTQSAELTVQRDLSFGSGSFNLSDPRAGLSDLPSYSATLTLSFDGTSAGQSVKWTQTYVMLASQDPLARQLTIQTSGVGDAESLFLAELDGVDYQVSGQGACDASAITQGDSLGDRLEPAGFLHPVIGADSAGSEAVNGIATQHYTFDQRALGQDGQNQSTGELWVAVDGGYLVKYLLSTKADAGYFGAGAEGTLTWDYELTQIGQPVEIKLPAGCPGGMLDVPRLPDASNVVASPGVLTYETASSLADTAAFYQEKLPALGWTIQGEADIKDTTALLDFRQSGQDLSIFVTSEAGVTTVNLLLSRLPK